MAKRKGKAANIPGQPTKVEFVEFARQRKINVRRAGDQWDVWDAGEWCDGNGTPILNWKLKLAMYAKQGFGMFRGEKRDRVAEAEEEYEQRQRYKPKDL